MLNLFTNNKDKKTWMNCLACFGGTYIQLLEKKYTSIGISI